MKAANILWKTASVITFIYGVLHIYGTFFSTDLHPNNEQVMNAMKATGLVMGEQHNLWNAWIGFNLNFGLFLLFAGFVGWYLAWKHFDVLKNSQALLLGITLCHGFSVLIAVRYLSQYFLAALPLILLLTVYVLIIDKIKSPIK